MTVAEFKVLGDVFLITLSSFFCVALPAYFLVRHFWPEVDDGGEGFDVDF